MSREIKFDFVYKGETGFHHKKYYIEELVDNSLAKLSDFHHQMELVAIRQFTGLLDKNGKEVFESDIVRWRGCVKNIEMLETYGKDEDWPDDMDEWIWTWPTDVVVMDRFPRFWLKNEEFGIEGDDLVGVNDCEVIGNIHEHPELLEQQ